MNIFLTGATGYIGGSVAVALKDAGHRVRGLVRSPANAELVGNAGIEPVVGSLADVDLLIFEARAADGVINTASADDLESVEAMLEALQGSGKVFLHTSGSSVIGDDARGEWTADAIFDEDTPFVVEPLKQPRHALNQFILGAADRGIRSAVICPSLIYGVGRGINPLSVQIPSLVQNAREKGVVQVVGKGANRWSNVHIDDVTALYLLAFDNATSGAFYFAENGEASFAEIGAAIATRLGLGTVESLDAEEAARRWGEPLAFYSLGSNSRVRAKRARHDLGWSPQHASVTSWILNEMPTRHDSHLSPGTK